MRWSGLADDLKGDVEVPLERDLVDEAYLRLEIVSVRIVADEVSTRVIFIDGEVVHATQQRVDE